MFVPTFTPDVELPEAYDPYPEDLLIKCHEAYRGLHAIHIHYKRGRDDFDLVMKIRLAEHKPQPSETPGEQPEEICELSMRAIEYDREEHARRGEYRVQFHRQTPKGLRRLSVLITTQSSSEPMVVKEMSRGDELEMAHSHIMELYSTNLELIGVATKIVNPLLVEFKNMVQSMSEMAKQSADVRAMELMHSLKMREISQDEQVELAKANAEKAKWDQLFDHVRETGALEAVVGGVMAHIQKQQQKKQPAQAAPRAMGPSADASPRPQPARPPGAAVTIPHQPVPAQPRTDHKQVPSTTVKDLARITKPEDEAPKAKRKTRKRTDAEAEPDTDASADIVDEERVDVAEPEVVGSESNDSELSKEERTQQLIQEAMEMPKIVLICQMLKETIDANRQWKEIYKILDREQADLFDTILSSKEEGEIYGCLEAIASTNIGNLLVLRRNLTEDQRPMIDMLTQVAINGPEALGEDEPEDD